jgi:polysaccharide biosynthesis/export protein
MQTSKSDQAGNIVHRTLDEIGEIRWTHWLIAACAALLVGCATTSALPAAPRSVDAPNLRYKIGPLDTLNVVVWRNPELSGPVTVRPDGFISMALIGDLKAAGKSPADLSQEVRAALAKLVLEPVVSVVVTGFQGVYSEQIRIVGEAARPQAVAYRQDMTLLDVMIQVGGMTDFADGNGAVLIRGSESGKQYSIRLKDLLKRGDISANVAVMPCDIVMVPQSWF